MREKQKTKDKEQSDDIYTVTETRIAGSSNTLGIQKQQGGNV